MMKQWLLRLDRHQIMLFISIFLGLGGGFYHLSSLFPNRAGMISILFLIWAICFIIGKILLHWRLFTHDSGLFTLLMGLAGFGLLMLARLAPNLAMRQGIWMIVAWCMMLIVALSPIAFVLLNRLIWWIFGGVVVLLLLTFIIGVHPSLPVGAPALWLSLNRLFIQPAELLKMVLIGIFATQISSPNWRNILISWGMVIVLFIIQRDLGVAVLFVAVLFQLAYLAGINWRILGVGLVGMMVIAIIGFFIMPIIRLRLAIWLNPWVDAGGLSYQLVQSLFAFADGGVFGRGFGTGEPELIPLAHSDFIFSAIAEEWGLLGVFIIIGLLALLMRMCLMIGNRQTDKMQQFWAWGIGAMLISQNIMIMTGALRIFPLTGMPFTFISYGGSSLVVSMMMVGVLLRLSASGQVMTVITSREKWYWCGILAVLGGIGCVALYWATLWDNFYL